MVVKFVRIPFFSTLECGISDNPLTPNLMERFNKLEEDFFKCKTADEAKALVSTCNSAEALISLHDRQGVYLAVSPSSLSFFGYLPEELIGNSAYDYFNPEDFQTIVKSHARVNVKQDVDSVDYRIITKSGNHIKVCTLSKPMTDSDGTELILTITFKR